MREGILENMSKQAKPFTPRPGQIDYTHARFAPVINCVLRYNGKILVVKRGEGVGFYPGFWNGISGFLDDERSFEKKVRDEIKEEVGIEARDILAITRGAIFHREEPEYNKTWIVHPVLVDVLTDTVMLDWEAAEYRWIDPSEAGTLDLLPGFDKVLATFFSTA